MGLVKYDIHFNNGEVLTYDTACYIYLLDLAVMRVAPIKRIRQILEDNRGLISGIDLNLLGDRDAERAIQMLKRNFYPDTDLFPDIFPTEVVVDVSHANKSSMTRDYLQFIVNKFPYVLSKNADDAINNGFRVSCMAPNTNMMQALQFAKAMKEYGSRVKKWYELVNSGASPSLSLLLMWRTGLSEGGRIGLSFEPNHHGPVPARVPLSSIKRLIQEERAPIDDKAEKYCVSKRYNIHMYWNNISKGKLVDEDLKMGEIAKLGQVEMEEAISNA